MDEFLRTLGFPWIVRKAALKFGCGSVDIISHVGTAIRITSLNCKGSWTRTYDTERLIQQPNVEGVICKTTAWWEGTVLRTRLEGSPLGTCDSWRYRRGDTLVVKTSIKRPREPEAVCFWCYERMQSLQQHLGGTTRGHLLRALAADQRRVERATRRDNAYLQKVLLDWDRWTSPADEFIRITANSTYPSSKRQSQYGSTGRLRSRASPTSGSPQHGMSQNPSASSLFAVASPEQSAIRSRLAVSANAVDSSLSALAQEPSLALPPAQRAQQASAPAPKALPAADVTFPPLPPSASQPTSFIRPTASISQASEAAATSTSRRALHYRSPSAESVTISALTPTSAPSQASPPTGTEALMVYKLHEYLDSRGIVSVVPVTHPHDTSEPQLLGMSPEQAEETAAKLRELETDMLLDRQGPGSRGCACCGLLVLFASDTLPDHLRVWEMSLTDNTG